MSYKMHILVCGGTGCRASASKNIICRLEDCLKERALEDESTGHRYRLFRFL